MGAPAGSGLVATEEFVDIREEIRFDFNSEEIEEICGNKISQAGNQSVRLGCQRGRDGTDCQPSQSNEIRRAIVGIHSSGTSSFTSRGIFISLDSWLNTFVLGTRHFSTEPSSKH